MMEVLQGPETNTPLKVATGKKPNWKKKKKKYRRSLLKPMFLLSMLHPFAVHLERWEQGVPVDCGVPWSREAIEIAVARGPHPTATTPDAITLVHEELEYQVNAGFSKIVMWDDIKHNLPKNFKVSPVAVIPQPNRRGRIILDLSFPVRRPPTTTKRRRMGEVIQESVNDSTRKLAPLEPVREIGQVLPKLFRFMAEVPPEHEIKFSKIDLSDGFWRMIVAEEEKFNFCYVMPDPPGSPIRIVVPSALQMGWAESPPYFCAATQAGRDIIEFLVDNNFDLPPHPLEAFVLPEDAVPPDKNNTPTTRDELLRFVSVYVDDYILAAVENEDGTLLRRMARAALWGIHSVFPPPDVTGHVGGKDSVSQKKLDKGDAKMAPIKEVLGFTVEGRRRTVWLPPKKADDIAKEIGRLLAKKTTPFKRVEKLTGKLIHTCIILPTGKALLTPFYRAMAIRPSTNTPPEQIGLGQNSELRAALGDMRFLIRSLARRPTHVFELVRLTATFIGMVDASSTGVGGIWFIPGWPPIVFRYQWPQHIHELYKTAILTNSDLEMGGILVAWFVLESCVDVRHKSATLFSDNSPTCSWTDRLISKAKGPTSSRLLRALTMRARTLESQVPEVPHWAGILNKPADIASRSFDIKDPKYSPYRLLAVATGTPGSTLASDLDAGWGAIATATVDVQARLRDWKLWAEYCSAQGQHDPYLSNSSDADRSIMLVGFAARYRTGELGKGKEVRGDTVAIALRHVGHMFEMSHLPDPRKPMGGKDLRLVFARLIRSYKKDDPPTESQIALPVKLFTNIVSHEAASAIPLEQAIADVITIMFYFLLRIGEIACASAKSIRRVKQFRRCDVSFWQNHPDGRKTRLLASATLEQMLAADEVTLKLTNQKNGVRDSTLHHEKVPGPFCPVKAVARRVDASRRAAPHNPAALLCLFAPRSCVHSRHVDQVLQRAAFRTTIWEEGFELRRIGPHSIRASGAMALFLNGIKEEHIRLIGRWRSNTWLTYIHTQISAVSAGVSRLMSRPVVFHNIAVRAQA